jgi:hypothetical protein
MGPPIKVRSGAKVIWGRSNSNRMNPIIPKPAQIRMMKKSRTLGPIFLGEEEVESRRLRIIINP